MTTVLSQVSVTSDSGPRADPPEPRPRGTAGHGDAGGRVDAAPHPDEVLDRLFQPGRSVQSVLEAGADLFGHVLPENAGTSVVLLLGGRRLLTVSTGRLAAAVVEAEFGHGGGPSTAAATRAEVTGVVDVRVDPRWPVYGRAAAQHGCVGVLASPLRIGVGVCGSIGAYADRSGVLPGWDRDEVEDFASRLGIQIASACAYHSARHRLAEYEAAHEARGYIERAKRILIERRNVTPEGALDILAHSSARAGLQVRGVARHLVITGELPAPVR